MRTPGIDRFDNLGVDIATNDPLSVLRILHRQRQPDLTQADYCYGSQILLCHQLSTSIDSDTLCIFAAFCCADSDSCSTTFKAATPSSPVTVGAVSLHIAPITSSYSKRRGSTLRTLSRVIVPSLTPLIERR